MIIVIIILIVVGVTIDNYIKKCKKTLGGINKAYLLPFVSYSRSEIKEDGMELIEFPNSTIFEFNCNGNYSQPSTTEEGSVSFDHSVTLELSEVYNVLDIHQFVKTDYRVIVLNNNKETIMFGTRNGLTCSLNNNSGSSKNEFNGFTLDFTGKEEKTGLLINDLASLGLTIN